jgi:hypothetical protein
VSVLSTILTPTVLLHYPKLQLNYFSMLAYVLSSSPEFILPSGGDASPQHQLHQIAGAMGKYSSYVSYFAFNLKRIDDHRNEQDRRGSVV